jgi:hypothetical protein
VASSSVVAEFERHRVSHLPSNIPARTLIGRPPCYRSLGILGHRSGANARDHTSALCGAITGQPPDGHRHARQAMYAVNPIPVNRSSVAAARAFIGSAPHHA